MLMVVTQAPEHRLYWPAESTPDAKRLSEKALQYQTLRLSKAISNNESASSSQRFSHAYPVQADPQVGNFQAVVRPSHQVAAGTASREGASRHCLEERAGKAFHRVVACRLAVETAFLAAVGLRCSEGRVGRACCRGQEACLVEGTACLAACWACHGPELGACQYEPLGGR